MSRARRWAVPGFCLSAGIPAAGLSRAGDYPNHPVRIIIGFGTSAVADTPARLLARKFGASFGQQFIIENKPGAGSNAAAEVKKSTEVAITANIRQ